MNKTKIEKLKKTMMEGSHKSYMILFLFTAIIVICNAVLLITLREGTTPGTFFEGISVESIGMLFDIFVLGFIFHYFSNKGERERKIERYLEEIDDLRHWESDEAKFRIMGNLKRLNKLNKFDIDLSMCYLQKAQFHISKISKLDSSKFEKSKLNGACLGYTKFYNCFFNATELKDAIIMRNEFYKCKFQGTFFEGSGLNESKFVDSNFEMTHFKEADLRNTTFKTCNFDEYDFKNAKLNRAKFINCDFRNVDVDDLTVKQLLEVSTLYKSQLPAEYEKEIRMKRPKLFKDPKIKDEKKK